LKHTICRKLSINYKQNTILVSHTFSFLKKYFNENISVCISTYLNRVVFTIVLVLVKIFVYSYNPQITNAHIFKIYKSDITLNKGLSMLVGISETIRMWFFKFFLYLKFKYSTISTLNTNTNINNNNDKLTNLKFKDSNKIFNQWLAGLIDGEIRNPVRLVQLNKICEKYNITLIKPSELTYYNGWFAGFFDSDGSVYLNLLYSQMFITASQKNNFLLDNLIKLYSGNIYIQKDSFKWVVFKKAEIIQILEYFKYCPSRSAKINRLKAIKKYHELR